MAGRHQGSPRSSTDARRQRREPRAPEAHRLVADAGREGRLQALHAQGDLRAAARDRGHPARARRSPDRRRRRRRDRHERRASRRSHRARLLRRVRHERPRRDEPAATDRAARARSRPRSRSAARFVTAIRSSCRTTSSSRSARAARRSTRWRRCEAAKKPARTVLAVANVLDSAIPRASDGVLYTHAGLEIGVASTKCFTTQLAALLMLAVYLGRRRGTLPDETRAACSTRSGTLPAQMREVSRQAEDVETHRADSTSAHATCSSSDAALQLPDRARRRAQAQGDLVHPRRGLRRRRDEARSDRAHRRGHARRRGLPEGQPLREGLSNMQEVKAREGQLIGICTEGDADVARASCSGEADGGPPAAAGWRPRRRSSPTPS